MTVKKLVETLGMEIVVEGDLEKEVINCYICDLLSWVMAKAKEGDVWLTVQTNINIVAVASLTDCACVIIVENIEIEQPTIDKAKVQGVTILRSSKTAYQKALEIGKII